MTCSGCGSRMKYHGLVEGQSGQLFESYKCPRCGRDALGPQIVKKEKKERRK